jgi:hypothetical protein
VHAPTRQLSKRRQTIAHRTAPIPADPPILAPPENFIVNWNDLTYIQPVNRLTKHEQLVICIVAGLLLLGWAVKTYRTAHPPAQTAEKSRP